MTVEVSTCPKCGAVILPDGATAHCPSCRWMGLSSSTRLLEVAPETFTPGLAELCASTRFAPITVAASARGAGFYPCNPSLAWWADRLWLTVRLVNYKLDTRHRPPYQSITLLGRLGREGDWEDLEGIYFSPDTAGFIEEPPGERFRTTSRGLEDIRLFPSPAGDILQGIAAVCDRDPSGTPKQAIFDIDPESGATSNLRLQHSPLPEKNWCPVIGYPMDDPHFVYDLRPMTRIVRLDRVTGLGREVGRYAFLEGQGPKDPLLSGSTQAIPFEDGFLLLAHERLRRNYQHRWVKLGADLRPLAQSKPFHFRQVGVEFACGLAWDVPPHRRLLVSFGVHDDEAWLASVDSEEIGRLLG